MNKLVQHWHRLGVSLLIGLSVSFTALAQSKPIIKKVNKATCYNLGEEIQVYGKNLGSPKIYRLVLTDGKQLHLISDIKQWQAGKITALLPEKLKIKTDTKSGQLSFRIGISRASTWVSNRDITIDICGEKTHRSASTAFTAKTKKPSIRDLSSNEKEQGVKVKSDPPASTDTVTAPADDEPENRSVGSLSGFGKPPVIDADLANDEQAREPQQEPKEAMVVSATMAEALTLATQAEQYGIRIKRRNRYPSLGIVVSILRIPADRETAEVIQQFRSDNDDLWIDFNHRYQLLESDNKKQSDPKHWAYELIGWSDQQRGCQPKAKIGVIDTGIATLDSINGASIVHKSLLSTGVKPAGKNHGTAIASLLLGSPDKNIPGLLPKAIIYSAEVFRQRTKKKSDTTAELIIKALAWMAREKVPVINLSLGGPRNLIVEVAIRRLYAQDTVIVSAAGVDKRGRALYPAAQKEVVAVRAVDAKMRPFSKKIKGGYIDFSAPGVDLWLLNEKGKARYMSGSSFAVPFVVANYSLLNKKNNGFDQLKNSVRDLGESGKDHQYGWGLVVTQQEC